MALITVIKKDTTIYIDGDVIGDCDMSGLPDDLHALQWNGTNGHVEWEGRHSTPVSSEEEIESALGLSLSTLLERRDAIVAQIKSEEDARIAEMEGGE
tara:strand:+ start:522 stop:815 length:294 start_codon:yes stop_codon:yes gene_type:complete